MILAIRVTAIGVRCAAAVVAAALLFAAPAGGSDVAPTFAQVVERLNAVNPGLKTLTAEQTALVHWLGIFHFRLRTTVYASRPALYKVVVHEAPAILRPLGDTFYMISSPEQVLNDYRATLIRQVAEGELVLELTAARSSVNPPSGTVLIDTHRWLMQEITLNYQWGQLKAQYRYSDVEGFLLPDSIRVWLPRFPLSADLSLTNYRLNAPIDPAVFAEAPDSTPAPSR